MKMKDTTRRSVRFLFSIRRYLIFFLLMAFVITCCMILFLNMMTRATGFELTQKYIEQAAKVTFLNVALLSLLCTVIDGIRRRIMVKRPVKRIVSAAEQIMKGDFSVRIPSLRSADKMSGFDVIADYFNQMAEELSGTETLRTDFIANVSHELKTPLAVIQNYGTLLQQPSLSEEKRQEYAKAITNTSRRLANLITNILKMNKLENQQIYPKAETYELGEQLCECLLAFESAWEEKDLEIETDVEEEVLVDTDAELLSLVWNNLFSNAVKFTEPGGTISLSLKAEGNLRLYGCRTPAAVFPQRSANTFSRNFIRGTPLTPHRATVWGLALVKRVIDIVGGDISVSSEVGKGSTFTVKLRREPDGAS